MSPYETLGVPRDATADQIKAAYRARAQATHPDKQGGNEDEFKAVGAAFTLLADPAAREAYDKFGTTGPVLTVEQEAEQVLATIFKQYMESGATEEPLFALTRAMVAAQSEQQKELKKAQRSVTRAQELLKGLKRKTPGPSTLTDVLTAHIEQANLTVNATTRRVAVLNQVKTLLADWENASLPPDTVLRAQYENQTTTGPGSLWGTVFGRPL